MTTEQKQQIERASIDAIQDAKDYVSAYSDLNRSDEITAEEVYKIAELCFTAGATHVIESPELYGLVTRGAYNSAIMDRQDFRMSLKKARKKIKRLESDADNRIAMIPVWEDKISQELHRADDAEAENRRLREALSLLVKLKRIKDHHGKTQYYQAMQPKAWKDAEEALEGLGK